MVSVDGMLRLSKYNVRSTRLHYRFYFVVVGVKIKEAAFSFALDVYDGDILARKNVY